MPKFKPIPKEDKPQIRKRLRKGWVRSHDFSHLSKRAIVAHSNAGKKPNKKYTRGELAYMTVEKLRMIRDQISACFPRPEPMPDLPDEMKPNPKPIKGTTQEAHWEELRNEKRQLIRYILVNQDKID